MGVSGTLQIEILERDANAIYRFKTIGVQWLAYVCGINLTNQTIRYATSVLRDIVPEGGRSARVGVRGSF